jgi:hypothetical protein
MHIQIVRIANRLMSTVNLGTVISDSRNYEPCSVSKEVLSKFHQACKKQQVSVTAGIIGCVLKTCETTLNIDPNNSIGSLLFH